MIVTGLIKTISAYSCYHAPVLLSLSRTAMDLKKKKKKKKKKKTKKKKKQTNKKKKKKKKTETKQKGQK